MWQTLYHFACIGSFWILLLMILVSARVLIGERRESRRCQRESWDWAVREARQLRIAVTRLETTRKKSK